jgi:mannosyl-3-phosphoglycerate phosphatase
MNQNIVIFTDLDGTLLDHDTYNYAKAEPCLNYIKSQSIPLIYTSSKTAVEIEDLCKQTNFNHPFISENGGLLSIPENYFSKYDSTHNKYNKTIIGKTRTEINNVLNTLTSSYKFKRFSDMSTEELIDHTGLEKQQAIYANQRDCTEPLLWLDEDIKLNSFKNKLIKHSLRLVSGGRFHHVMGKHDKATTMTLLIKQFEKACGNQVTSIALGDSPNDLEMLLNANHGIAIPNPHAPRMCVDNHASLNYAEKAGPQGWNDTLLALLKELAE